MGPTNRDLLHTLVSDIRKNYARDNAVLGRSGLLALRSPDVIVITGDLSWSAAETEFESPDRESDVAGFLDGLAGALLNGERHRVVVVPGNHDVSWRMPRGAIRRVRDGDSGMDAITGLDRGSVFRYRPGRRYVDRLGNYQAFSTRWDPRTAGFPTARGWFRANFRTRYDLVVWGMSSVSRNDKYSRDGSIDQKDVEEVALDVANFPLAKSTIALAVFHHGLAQDRSAGNDAVPKNQLKYLSDAGIRLFLHGHTHQSEFERMPDLTSSSLHIVGAGTLGASRGGRPESVGYSYNLLRFSNDGSRVIVSTRTRPGILSSWGPVFWYLDSPTPSYTSWLEIPLKSR